MSIRASLYLLLAASLIVVSAWVEAGAETPANAVSASVADDAAPAEAAEPVELFDAIDDGLVDVKFIARDDHRGRVFIENKTGEELQLRMPEAFVGVPVLAQLGGGGGGLGGGGGGGQSVGGGGGGGLGGGGGGGNFGGGGGAFSIAPEKTAKINVPLLCLDHGKRIPSSKKPYKLVPAEEHLGSRPEVIELLAAFGRGELQRGAAQAAVWHANSDMSWQALAAKLDGTARSFVRNPYFTRYEIQAAIAYVQEATRRAATREPTEESDTPDDGESMSEGVEEEAYESPSPESDDLALNEQAEAALLQLSPARSQKRTRFKVPPSRAR